MLRLSALSGTVVTWWADCRPLAGPLIILSFRNSLRDVRKLAEGSKRFVTGGMDVAGVLAICLKRRKKQKFWLKLVAN